MLKNIAFHAGVTRREKKKEGTKLRAKLYAYKLYSAKLLHIWPFHPGGGRRVKVSPGDSPELRVKGIGMYDYYR